MGPAQRAARAAESAATAAHKTFLDDNEMLAAARAANVAAVRAARAAFPSPTARLEDARERARVAACSARIVVALAVNDAPTFVMDSAIADIQRDLGALAQRAEEAARGDDAEAGYQAALEAAYDAAVTAWIIERDDHLKAAHACCRHHHHGTNPASNDADAAYIAAYAAYAMIKLAAYDLNLQDAVRALKTCCRKLRYATKAEAEAAAERDSEKAGVALWFYQCDLDVCGGWHLTKRRPA